MKLIQKLKHATKRPSYVVYSVLGYYSTYDEAIDALNNSRQPLSLHQVYDMWLPSHAKEC